MNGRTNQTGPITGRRTHLNARYRMPTARSQKSNYYRYSIKTSMASILGVPYSDLCRNPIIHSNINALRPSNPFIVIQSRVFLSKKANNIRNGQGLQCHRGSKSCSNIRTDSSVQLIHNNCSNRDRLHSHGYYLLSTNSSNPIHNNSSSSLITVSMVVPTDNLTEVLTVNTGSHLTVSILLEGTERNNNLSSHNDS
jgi:hypothetical protein